MSQSQRHERLRLLIKKLNRERKQRGKQVDILCNDLIAANRDFVDRLEGVGFAASFYKALLGTSNLRMLLTRATRLIEQELPGVKISFFLRYQGSCRLYDLDFADRSRLAGARVEDCFGPELAESICKLNRRCTAEEVLSAGIDGNLQLLSDVSMTTLPLNDLGRALGFVLLHCSRPRQLTRDEVRKVGLITCGLSHAIRRCHSPAHVS
jgi:hypothetical protein